jgi:hypothetical protein
MSFEKRKVINDIIQNNIKYKGLLFRKIYINYKEIIKTLLNMDLLEYIEFIWQRQIYTLPNEKEKENIDILTHNMKLLSKYSLHMIFLNYFPNELRNEFLIIKCKFNHVIVFYGNKYYII